MGEKKAKKKCDCKKQEELEQKIGELTELLQRVQADFENYKKRTETEKVDIINNASKEVIQKILPIVDNFELALKNTENVEEFKKGMEMIYAQLMDIFHAEGVKTIDCLGKKFDPELHEALIAVDSDEEKNTIIEEFQKGYTLNGKVIRHSKVKVSKEAQDDNSD